MYSDSFITAQTILVMHYQFSHVNLQPQNQEYVFNKNCII